MTEQQRLLIVWVTFTVLVSAGVVAVLIWAVRSGQFAHQDRARRLPLEAGIPEATEEAKTTTTATATATATASPCDAGGFNGLPHGKCVPPSNGTPLGGVEGATASSDGKGA